MSPPKTPYVVAIVLYRRMKPNRLRKATVTRYYGILVFQVGGPDQLSELNAHAMEKIFFCALMPILPTALLSAYTMGRTERNNGRNEFVQPPLFSLHNDGTQKFAQSALSL